MQVRTLCIIAAVTWLIPIGGCLWQDNPRADLVASQTVFTAAVESVTAASRAGQIGDDEMPIIDTLVHRGSDLLETWEQTVLANEEPGDILIETFLDVLNELLAWQDRIDGRDLK